MIAGNLKRNNAGKVLLLAMEDVVTVRFDCITAVWYVSYGFLLSTSENDTYLQSLGHLILRRQPNYLTVNSTVPFHL